MYPLAVILSRTLWVSGTVSFILQVMKLRFGESKSPAQDHMAKKWQSQNSDSGLTPEPMPFVLPQLRGRKHSRQEVEAGVRSDAAAGECV